MCRQSQPCCHICHRIDEMNGKRNRLQKCVHFLFVCRYIIKCLCWFVPYAHTRTHVFTYALLHPHVPHLNGFKEIVRFLLRILMNLVNCFRWKKAFSSLLLDIILQMLLSTSTAYIWIKHNKNWNERKLRSNIGKKRTRIKIKYLWSLKSSVHAYKYQMAVHMPRLDIATVGFLRFITKLNIYHTQFR